MSNSPKASTADYEFLHAVSQLNRQLSDENRHLLGRLHELKRLGDSRNYRIVERITDEVVRGDAHSRFALLANAAKSAGDRAAGLWRSARAARERRAIRSRSILSGENRPEVVSSLFTPSDNLKVGVSFFGGLGDGILISTVIEAIKRKYLRSDIYFFTYHPLHRQLFKDNSYLKEVVLITHGPYEEFSAFGHDLIDRDQLDIWYECKYATKVHYGPHSRVLKSEQDATALAFPGYDLNFDVFPFSNNLLSTFCAERNLSLLDLIAVTALLDLSDPQLYIMPSLEDLKITEVTEQFGEYVTIHHGSDPNWNIRGKRINHQIKNWYKERWEEVIAHITATTSLKVIQLGIRGEDTLSGAIHYFMGRTTVQEAALIIKNARFHLDTEGGLVHLARAVHNRSIVLFGPTPVDFFAYPQNINLKEGNCHDCWWSTHEWINKCPLGMSRPTCMDSIQTSSVIRAVDGLVSQASAPEILLGSDLRLFERDIVAAHEELLQAMEQASGGHARGPMDWAYLYAIDHIGKHSGEGRPLKILEVGGGQGPLSLFLTNAGHESHVCDLRFTAPGSTAPDEAARFLSPIADKVKFRFGAACNLPYESNVFDVVLCFSLLGQFPFHEATLRELLRVLRPGGLAVLGFPVTADGIAGEGWEAHQMKAFTESELDKFLGKFKIEHHLPSKEVVSACSEMQSGGVEGIPRGLAMGALCVLKQSGIRSSSSNLIER